MPFLQDVSPGEIDEAMRLLSENNALLSVTARYKGRWVTFRTRVVAGQGDTVWVDLPKTDHLPTVYTFPNGEQLGVTFNAAHRKFVCQAKVMGMESYRPEDGGAEQVALKLRYSHRIRKIERRLCARVSLPPNEGARVTLWLGGQDLCPDEDGIAAAVWSGRVLNISTGGLLVRTSNEAAKFVDPDDIVGIHVLFDGQDEPVAVDARIRHCAQDGDMALIGIQFLATEEIPENAAALEMIRSKIPEAGKPPAVAQPAR